METGQLHKSHIVCGLFPDQLVQILSASLYIMARKGRRSEAQKRRWQKFRLRTGPTRDQPSFAQDEWSETQMQMDLGRPFAEPHLMDLSMVETKYIKEEDYGHMIPCVDEDEQDEEEKPFAELNCKTETDDAEYNITYSEPLQTTAEIEVKIEDEDEHLQESDFLQERVSEHLDCIQQDIYEQNDELNLQLKGSLYHCAVCRKSFTALKVLKKHQKMHSVKVNKKKNSGKKQHKCPHCEEILRTARNLKSHMLKHAYSKNYKCAQCGKDFARSNDLKRHMLSHAGETKCAQCGKTFLRPSKLKTHMLTHTGEKPHECAHCGKGFSQASDLKIHVMQHTGEKPCKCTQCGKSFKTSNTLKKHMSTTHTGEGLHICGQCGKAFSRFTYLRIHMLTHTCPQCGSVFPTTTDLNIHKLVHGGEMLHKCAQCEKAFRTSLDLERHMLTHTFAQCGNVFPTTTDLKIHMLVHSGEMPHKCAQCEKAFRTSLDLERHMLTHTCAQCGSIFPTSMELKLHMLIHRGENFHECRLCEKKTPPTSTDHKHTPLPCDVDDKPYKCELCGKAFARGSYIKIHMRVHTGEKPHKCVHCGKAFAQRANLSSHVLMMHTGKWPQMT